MFSRQGLLFDDILDEPLRQAKRTKNKRRGLGLDSPIWSIDDLSKYLGISVYTIRAMYSGRVDSRGKNGKDIRCLKRFSIGSKWRWIAEEVKQFVGVK